jgi:hypothetical protein
MLPIIALLFSASPLQPLPGPAVPGPAGGIQEVVAVAASPDPGAVLLAVWRDLGGGISTIHAARVDATNLTVLDAPFDVTLDPNDGNGPPQVAFGGRSFDPAGYFLVAYESKQHPSTVRVSLDGGISQRVTFSMEGYMPFLISDGDRFVMLYMNGQKVNAALLSADGASVVDDKMVATTGIEFSATGASAGPGSYFAVWTDEVNGANAGVFGCSITSGATLTVGAPVTLAPYSIVDKRGPSIATLPDGGYRVAWVEGSMPDNNATLIETSIALGVPGSPQDTGDGGFLPFAPEERSSVVYEPVTRAIIASWGYWSGDSLHLSLLPAPYSGPATSIALLPQAFNAALVARSGALFMSYTLGERLTDASDDSLLEKRDTGGALISGPVVLSRSLTQQVTVAVACSDDRVLAMYEEYHADSGYDVMAQPVDGGRVAVDNGPLHQSEPMVVGGDGGVFFALWRTEELGNNIFAGLVDRTGSLLAAPFDPVPYHLYDPAAVAGAAGQFLVAWISGGTVYYRRFAEDGTALDALPVLIADPASGYAQRLDVAPVGNTFMVVWTAGNSDPLSIRFARVGFDGALLDPNGKELAQGCVSPQSLRVASEGGDAVVAWRDNRDGPTEIWGGRVHNGAPVEDGGRLWLPAPGPVPFHNSGERYLALNEVPGGVLLVYADNGVNVVHVVQGQPIDMPAVLAGGIPVDSVAATSSAQETVVVAAIARLPGPPGTTLRVEVSTLTRGAPGDACAYGFDCSTGVCTAGRCTGSDGGIPPDAGTGPDAGMGNSDGGGPGPDGGSLEMGHLGVHCGGCDAGGPSFIAAALIALLRRRRGRCSALDVTVAEPEKT